ncbi:MAG TPA: glycosyltransferase [Polyangiaceae bacterium]|nr:glycosyltransferase [Polyangiaceae bacterium]
MPLVSVVVPAFNAAATLARTRERVVEPYDIPDRPTPAPARSPRRELASTSGES